MLNQTVVTSINLQVRNLFVNITDYPNFIRGQGDNNDVQYSDEVSSVTAANDVVLLLYKSETNYPNTNGHLIRVWYEIGFELKAGNATADIIYQLQAKDKDGTWVDMSAAVTVSNIGTSYVAKLIKGYLDIQSGISKLPFEMRLIFQSNESNADVLISFSCTWSYSSDWGQHTFAILQAGDNLYCSTDNTIRYQTGNDSWSACDGTMGQVRGFAYSDVATPDTYVLYAVRNGTVIELSGTTWSAIAGSPDGAWSILHHDSDLFIGTNGGDVEVSTDGATWATTSLTAGAAVKALAWFGGFLYAGSANGKVWKLDGSWSEVSTGLSGLSITAINALCVHDSNLYAAGTGADVAKLDGTTWITTGGLAGTASGVFALVSFTQSGKPAAILYAATGNGADVDWFDERTDTWTNTAELSGEYQVLSLGIYTKNDTIYAGTNNHGRIWKGSVSATWAGGEGIARLKNDEASDGQKTRLEIVGRILE